MGTQTVFAKWLSCNGEAWGIGPTAVFASAAALFLYNELEASILVVGDHQRISLLEQTMVSTMVLGMLALMIHLWVCCMRFFQYYLDTLIKDSPNMILEMTTAGLLGGQEMAALGPLTRFLRQQQPQIHITMCWFLSLCYADYVRKHYCQRFNMPYLEQWQAELQERAARQMRRTVARASSFVGCVQRRLCGFTQRHPPEPDHHTVFGTLASMTSRLALRAGGSSVSESVTPKTSVEVSRAASCVWAKGRGRGSDGGLHEGCGWKECAQSQGELCVRLFGTSSETTVEAIEKLRNYIQSTRCSCGRPPNASVPGSALATPKEPEPGGLPVEENGNPAL